MKLFFYLVLEISLISVITDEVFLCAFFLYVVSEIRVVSDKSISGIENQGS